LKKFVSIVALVLAVALPQTVGAEDVSLDTPSDSTGFKISFTPHGYANLQTFRIMNYTYKDVQFEAQQYNHVVANISLDVKLSPRLTTHIGFESYVWFNNMPDNAIKSGQARILDPIWSVYLHQAENVVSFDEVPGVFKGEFGLGYFPFKYNPDAWNLGEYLFRSGTYPGWLTTTFDVPWPRLTGLRLSGTLFDVWHNDLLLTTEMEKYPLYDISFTWLTDLKVGRFLDVGAGWTFARMIPFKYFATTPHTISSSVDNSYINPNGDTAFYTFQGHKVMARVSIDPKGIFTEKPAIMGPEDLKIYGEAAILGVQDQGPLYNDMWERMPMMFGVNLPMFRPVLKFLDVASVQFEYYKTPYPNNYDFQQLPYWQGTPLPFKVPVEGMYYIYDHDNWKWSVHLRRNFGDHFSLIGQAARDHWRTSSGIGFYVHDAGEGMVNQTDWYWALKAVSYF
jgi:hypothetical protein